MTDMLQGGLLGIVKVGKKRSRRNKTDGEIINASGAITGGKYKNASANLLARRSEIETLEGQIRAKKEEYSQASDRLSTIQERQKKLSEEELLKLKEKNGSEEPQNRF